MRIRRAGNRQKMGGSSGELPVSSLSCSGVLGAERSHTGEWVGIPAPKEQTPKRNCVYVRLLHGSV